MTTDGIPLSPSVTIDVTIEVDLNWRDRPDDDHTMVVITSAGVGTVATRDWRTAWPS